MIELLIEFVAYLPTMKEASANALVLGLLTATVFSLL